LKAQGKTNEAISLCGEALNAVSCSYKTDGSDRNVGYGVADGCGHKRKSFPESRVHGMGRLEDTLESHEVFFYSC
jgi:hypothetical protein